MFSRSLTVAIPLLVVTTACGPTCGFLLTDACRKAEELGYLVGMQLTDATTVGNAVLGQGGALHGAGKVAIALRASGLHRDTPRFRDVTIRHDSVPGRTAFPSDEGVALSFGVDLAVGAYAGAHVGDTRAGALDVLASVSLTPTYRSSGLHVRARAIRGLAVGARIGLIEETRTMPGVSLTAMLGTTGSFSVDAPATPIDSGGTATITLRDGILFSSG